MTLNRLRFVFSLAALVAAVLTLAACGRNGPPLPPPGPVAAEPPPAAATVTPAGTPASTFGGPAGPTAQETAQKNGFDIFGNPVAPPGQKKTFPLDPLLQ